MAAVDITTIGIEYDTSGLDKGTRAQDKTAQSANKMADSLGGAEKSTKSVTQATNYYTTALQAAAAAMGISKIIDQIDQYTKFTAQLKLATGSTTEYAASLNAVRQISKDAQSSLAGTGTLYAKIATGTRELGVAQSQVAKITESINLSLKVSGATAGEAASAQLQLAQAFASGTLRGEEFNAVNEAAPRLMKALADGMGRPVGALKDMASNGLITSEIMANVLPKALEQLREEAKQVQTISGAFQVLKNNVMEFIGTQSQASGVVSVITGAIGLLADNLVILAGAIVTITATKFANFLSGLAVSAYESVAANRALAAANLATAQSNVAATASTLALADARVIELRQAVLAASGEAALAVTMNGLIPAQARATAASLAHTEALAAQTVAVGAASTGAGILRGALAFLGGPIGLIVTALGVAATAWSVFGDKAEEANDKTTQSTIESSQEVIARLDQEISKLKDRNKLRSENPELAKGSSEANLKALTQAQKDYNEALSGTGKAAGLNATAQAEMVKVLGQAYGQIYQRVNEVNSETKKLTEGTTSEKMKKWLGENGSAAQRMAAAMAEAKKEVGVLTPEMEKLIKAKFADKTITKETYDIYKDLNKLKMVDLKMESGIMKEINDESKKAREETKKWMQEQRDNYTAANKSLDAHAQKMLEANELAQLEIDLLGTSAVERNTIIEQKKIQLALDRELQKIREMALTDTARQDLIDKATAQANIDKSTAELRAQQGEWSKFYGEIYNGLSDSLYRGFEAGKGFGKSFLDSIKNLFKTNVLKIAVQAVMGGAGGMVSSMASAMSGGSGGSGSGIGIDSVFNIGSTLMKGFTAAGAALNTSLATGIGELGATMGSEFMLSVSSMMQGGAASGAAGTIAGGLTSAATAMPYVAAAVAAFQGMKAINGDYRLGGLSADMGALLGIMPRLFGRKAPELQQSELSGTVNASGFNATTRDVYKAEGGFFRSDKWSEVKNPMAGASELSAQYNAISAVAKSYADLLGLSTESLASFSKSFTFNLSKTGDAAKDAEANQKLINDLFVGITNDITNLLAPSISAFGKEGENVSQTFQRLAMSLTNVNAVMKAVGFAEFGKSLEGANAAQRLSDLSGGIEKLASGAQYFYENFLNEAEKIKPIADQVSATMARLGQSSVDTIPEFKSLVQGLDLTSESGAKMYAELIAIAPQFKAIADSKAAEEMQKLSEATRELELASQKAKAIADERKALQDEYNSLTMSSTELFAQYKNGLDESNRSLADSIQAIKDKTVAEEAAAAKAASIAAERKTLQDEYNQLTMTAVELMAQYRNGLDASNQALFDQINVIKAARDKAMAEEKAAAEALAAAQKEASDIAAERATLQDEYNRLTMTEIELMGLKRASLKEQNRDVFDLIQAEKARREEVAKAEAAFKASESEWAQSMKAAFDSQTGALKNIISEFGTLAKSLQDYSRSLTLGEAAKLSPETRYKLLGEEINALMPQVKAKDKDALAKWAKVSEEYLKASEGYNATSVGYFKDLELIKTYTDEAAQYAQSQVDVAQLQLNAMTNSVDAINGVNQSVQQVLQAITGAASGSGSSGAEMGLVAGYQANVLRNVENLGGLENLYQGAISGNPDAYRNLKGQMQRWAQMGLDKNALDTILGVGWYDKLKAIPGFANGGVANGLAMVGERGPELVNFKSPSRVYNANDTQSIIGGSNSKETNDLLKKQNLLIEKLIYKLEGASEKQVKAVGNVAQKIGAIDANVKFGKAGT